MCMCLEAHRWVEIDADHLAGGARAPRSNDRVEPRAAPQVHDGLAWLDRTPQMWVTYARKRCHGPSRGAVEPHRVISEQFGSLTSVEEVVLSFWIVRHVL